ncbi:hypothetical protein BHE74_00007863 [Ensete ventricosum]|nr:hypothetical protein BHE74_00007863 [Ensete ventricosum]RZR98874.1 hypothetical protein BHM03_00028324 [Ensete ventricosum]
MAIKSNSGEGRTRSSLSIIIVVGLCCFFYILGAWQKSGFGKGDSIALQVTKQTECTNSPNLNFETHHGGSGSLKDIGDSEAKTFKPCGDTYTDYTPCQDQGRAMTFPRENMIYRERHCPPDEEKLYCLIPAPKGYVAPFPWPKSRDYVPYANVPYKSLTVEKAVQNWVQYEGNVFRFPGGGTQFPQGADKYIDQLASVIPIDNGTVRTALDTGCGVCIIYLYISALGLSLFFCPDKKFCPPINWKNNYQAWQRTKEDLEEEQRKIEEIAELLCWEKVSEKAEIAIWRKRINAELCPRRQDETRINICESANPDDVWYKKMEPCINQYPEVNNPEEFAGGELKPFPERLNAIPPRIASSLGSFAAAIESPKLWVMNVVPTIAEISTLGVIYERGLIGIYHDWCEAFSTYPRTYDLIHANGVFSLYQDKCKMEDILLEMDRILRPEGAVIFRDDIDVLLRVKKTISGMRWNTKLVDHEDGPLIPEKVLVAVKQYWVGGSTSKKDE